ncbi:MAG: hypothetical protein RPR40_04755 [Bermanella sp.]
MDDSVNMSLSKIVKLCSWGSALVCLSACLELSEGSRSAPDAAALDAAPLSDCAHGIASGYNFTAGQSYFGAKQWIEYIPGTLPIIIAAPHGGELTPDEVPVFNDGLAQDGGSQAYARAVAQALYQLTGRHPHLVINHLARNRLNLNRAPENDNRDNAAAMVAWQEFHHFVEQAKSWVSQACQKGLYLDFHTNGHDHGYVELGYLLTREQLNLSDAQINQLTTSSLTHLASQDGHSLAALVHGEWSLGQIMHEQYNILTIPNATDIPFQHRYFSGGYNTRSHGSVAGGVIDAIQIESHFNYVNSGASVRLDYSLRLAHAIHQYMQHWYGFDFDPLH